MFVGAKNDTRDVGGEGAVFAGLKKCTRDGLNVVLSTAKNLAGSTNIHWFRELETLRPKGPKR